MLKKFTKHPADQGETYFQHMWAAWKIIHLLKVLELKCAVHSIFPFMYTDAVSAKIKCLQKMTNRAPSEDNELYETYGGD
jgi:hypothetical protein